MRENESYFALLNEHRRVFAGLDIICGDVARAAELMVSVLTGGNKLLTCGNGGSAADAQHFAAEVVGRFERERKALPAVALTTDTSILTAVGNDYGFESIFARQMEGLGTPVDCLVGISTSGNSKNVMLAVEVAKDRGIKCIGLLGKGGGEILGKCDLAVVVPGSNTARIQEAHIFIIHFWAAWIERELFGPKE
jgi:D-sedoheptulose 7-phosphate isomerase